MSSHSNPSEKLLRFYRTLVAIEGFNDDRSIVYMMVVGWSAYVLVPVETANIFDAATLDAMIPRESRLFVRVNLHAEHSKDLRFTNWEFADKPNEGDNGI